MNREVIFRGQRIDNGEWVYGYLYQLPLPSGIGCMILTTDNTHEDNSINPKYHLAFSLWVDLFPVKPDTVGQFTGMRDKHGRKIYEGDVVRRRESAFGYVDTGEVKYDCHLGAFVLEYEDYGRTYQGMFKKGFSDNDGKCTIEGTYSYEVIGNIHDNPELLKRESTD